MLTLDFEGNSSF